MTTNESIGDKFISHRMLSSFDINDELLQKLNTKGFTLKSEIQAVSDDTLRLMCNLSDEQLNTINELIRKSHKTIINHLTVSHIRKLSGNRIHTSLPSLDIALGGGLEVSKVTQICGEGGVGKTQICMQLCITVQIPEQFGGLSSHALYIDTENNLRPERLQSMAAFCLESYPELKQRYCAESMVSNVHLFSCNTNSRDLFELIMSRIEHFLDHHQEVRLVIIDSIANLFRYDYKGNEFQREYEISQMGHKIKSIAHRKRVAFLISNQVTYIPVEGKDTPALGKLWQTYCSTSFLIKRYGEYRKTYTLKSVNIETDRHFFFQITKNGIKEVLPDEVVDAIINNNKL
ncbi:DNA repair protein RAD51 homolog 3-like [Oppia nitens]|uniref:DNA repair protein RAD51 homolog 3-like n=1 Tax=Oppia nitens TaxID=1686743 RepID=UPI0023DBCEDD|nr:DNA repair protein RAD51 homolog 3-like [Oppia nitens]